MSKPRNFNLLYKTLKQKIAHLQIIMPIFLVVLILGSFGFNVLASNYDPPQKTINIDSGYNFNNYIKAENWIIGTGRTGFEIWDVNTSSLIIKFQNVNSEIQFYHGEISPSNNLITFIAETGGGYFNQLVFFNILSKRIERIENFTTKFDSFAFSSTGKYYFYFNTIGNTKEIFYSANLTKTMEFTGNFYLNFSPDDSYFAQYINQSTINIYRTKNWKIIKTFNFSSNAGETVIRWSPTSNFIIVEQLSYDYINFLVYTKMNWSVYDLQNFNLLKQDLNMTFGDLSISPNGKYVVFGTENGFQIFNSSDWTSLYQNNDSVLWSPLAYTLSLEFSNNGTFAFLDTTDYSLPTNYDSVLYLYNSLTNTMTKLSFFNDIYQKYNGINSMVGTFVQISPSGRYVFLSTSIGKTDAIIEKNQNYLSGYSVSVPITNKLLLYDLTTNKTIFQETTVNQNPQYTTVQFSKDDKIALLSTDIRTPLRIISLETGKTLLSSNTQYSHLFINSKLFLMLKGHSAYIWTNFYQKNLIASVASFFNIYIELILSVFLLVSLILYKKNKKIGNN